MTEEAKTGMRVAVSGKGRGMKNPYYHLDETPFVDNQTEVKDDESVSDEQQPSGGNPLKDLTSMINSMDEATKQLEMQRKMSDAKQQLQNVCYQLGISKDDQEFLDKKFNEIDLNEKKFSKNLVDEETIDNAFFTRDDGSTIKIKTLPGSKPYNLKKDLLLYLRGYYDAEIGILRDAKEMRDDMKKFRDEDIGDISAIIANNLLAGIQDRKEELEQEQDPVKKKRIQKLIKRMESSYTFEEILDVFGQYPRVISSIIGDTMKTPVRAKEIGECYRAKLKQQNTISSLYGLLQKDFSKSIEKQFLSADEYVEGYENLFAFVMIRHFSMENWTDPYEYTKEAHNACVIVLNNLLLGRLDTAFRDQVVDNIRKVWVKLKEEIDRRDDANNTKLNS